MLGCFRLNGRLWLKTVISCQHRKAPLRGPTAEMLSRITVYLFRVGHCGFLVASLFVAEAVISHPGPQGPKKGPPGQDGDNRSAERRIGRPTGKNIMRALGPRWRFAAWRWGC